MSQAPPPLPSGPVPLTIGQILDRIFRLFREHLRLFLNIASVPAAGVLVIYATIGVAIFMLGLFPRPGQPPPDPFKMMAVLFSAGVLGGLAFMLVYAIFEAAGTHAALQANRENPVTFREAYAIAFRNAGLFLRLMILRALRIGLSLLVCNGMIAGLMLLPFARSSNPAPGPVLAWLPVFFLVYLGSYAYAIIMGLRLSLALPACMAENLTARAALRRTLALTRNAKGRIFVVLLVVSAMGYAVLLVFEFAGFAVALVLIFLSSAMHLPAMAGYIGLGIAGLCLFIAMCVWVAALTAGFTIALAVLYQDQRLRIDGVAAAADGEPA